jgi:hypothetical protein
VRHGLSAISKKQKKAFEDLISKKQKKTTLVRI